MQVAIHSPWGEEQTIPHARPFCHPKQKGKSCLLKKSWKLLYVQHFILMRRRNLLLMKEEQKTLNCTRPTTFLQMKESNVWLTIWGGAVTLRIPTLDAQVCSFCVQLRLRRNKKTSRLYHKPQTEQQAAAVCCGKGKWGERLHLWHTYMQQLEDF